jgi:hypothetical protein
MSEIESFQRRAKKEAQKWRDFLVLPPDQIAAHAKEYAERMVSHSCRSIEEIVSTFQRANLTPDAQIAGVQGEMRSTQYARIVARKSDGVQTVHQK